MRETNFIRAVERDTVFFLFITTVKHNSCFALHGFKICELLLMKQCRFERVKFNIVNGELSILLNLKSATKRKYFIHHCNDVL